MRATLYLIQYKMAEWQRFSERKSRLQDFKAWLQWDQGAGTQQTQQTQQQDFGSNAQAWAGSALSFNNNTEKLSYIAGNQLPWINMWVQNLGTSKSNIELPWITYKPASENDKEINAEYKKIRAENAQLKLIDTKERQNKYWDSTRSEYRNVVKTWVRQPINNFRKFGNFVYNEAQNLTLNAQNYILQNHLVPKRLVERKSWQEITDEQYNFAVDFLKNYNNKKIEKNQQDVLNYNKKINNAFENYKKKNLNPEIEELYNNKTISGLMSEWDGVWALYKMLEWASQNWTSLVDIALMFANPVVWNVAMWTDVFAQESMWEFDDLINHGATYTEARNGALLVWALNTSIELLLERFLWWAQQTSARFLRKTFMNNVEKEIVKNITKKWWAEILGKSIWDWGKSSFVEWLEEVLQTIVWNAWIKTVDDTQKITEWWWQSFDAWALNPLNLLAWWASVLESKSQNKKIDKQTDIEALNYVMEWEQRKAQRMQQARDRIRNRIMSSAKNQETEWENSWLSNVNDYNEWRNVWGSKASSEMATEKTVNTLDEESVESKDSTFFSTDENGDYIVYNDGSWEQKIYAWSNRFIRDWMEKSQFTELSDTPYNPEFEEYRQNFQRLIEKLSDPNVKGQDFVVIWRTEKWKDVRLSKLALKHIIEDHGKINVNTLLKAINKPSKQKWETEWKKRPYIVLDLWSKNKEFIVWLAPDSWTKNEDTAEYYTVTTSREAWSPKTSSRNTRFQLKYEEKDYNPWVAGKNEKNISGKEWVKQRNKINDETIEQLAKKYWVKVEVIKWLVKVLKNWKWTWWYAYGKYLDQVLTLSEQIKESTAPHELLHAIFDMIDPETKAYLISQVMKSEGWSAKKAEEWLADSFSNFFRTGKIEWAPKSTWGKIKIFFKRVRSFINGLGRWRNELEEIFSDIITSEGIEDLQWRIDQNQRLQEAKARMRERFMQYAKNAEKMQNKAEKNEWKYQTVEDYKNKTDELYNPIYKETPEEVEKAVRWWIEERLSDEWIDAKIIDLALAWSRSRWLENKNSDLDIVVEFEDNGVREDDLFDILNDEKFEYEWVEVDINPIVAGKSGTLSEYLNKAEEYLNNKSEENQKYVDELWNVQTGEDWVKFIVRNGKEYYNKKPEKTHLNKWRDRQFTNNYKFDIDSENKKYLVSLIDLIKWKSVSANLSNIITISEEKLIHIFERHWDFLPENLIESVNNYDDIVISPEWKENDIVLLKKIPWNNNFFKVILRKENWLYTVSFYEKITWNPNAYQNELNKWKRAESGVNSPASSLSLDSIIKKYKNANKNHEKYQNTWKNEENDYTNSWQRSSSGSAWKISTLNAPFSFNTKTIQYNWRDITHVFDPKDSFLTNYTFSVPQELQQYVDLFNRAIENWYESAIIWELDWRYIKIYFNRNFADHFEKHGGFAPENLIMTLNRFDAFAQRIVDWKKKLIFEKQLPNGNYLVAITSTNLTEISFYESDNSKVWYGDVRFQLAWDIESEAFKKRFGDSKVVDDEWNPLVVYHWTQNKFNTFKKMPWGRWALAVFGDWFYFAESKKRAWEFKRERAKNLWDLVFGWRVMEVYLSIQNPYEVKYSYDMVMPSMEELIKKWYDWVKADTWEEIYWIAFKPNQIKSATDNVGTYDPNNDDIRYQEADDIDPEAKSPEEMVKKNDEWLDVMVKFISEKQKKNALNVSEEILTKDGNPYMWTSTNKYISKVITDWRNVEDSKYKEFTDEWIQVSRFTNNSEMSYSYAKYESNLAPVKKFKSIEEVNKFLKENPNNYERILWNWIDDWVLKSSVVYSIKKTDSWYELISDSIEKLVQDMKDFYDGINNDWMWWDIWEMPKDKKEALNKLQKYYDDNSYEVDWERTVRLLEDGKVERTLIKEPSTIKIFKTKEEALAEWYTIAVESSNYHYQWIIQNLKNPLVVDGKWRTRSDLWSVKEMFEKKWIDYDKEIWYYIDDVREAMDWFSSRMEALEQYWNDAYRDDPYGSVSRMIWDIQKSAENWVLIMIDDLNEILETKNEDLKIWLDTNVYGDLSEYWETLRDVITELRDFLSWRYREDFKMLSWDGIEKWIKSIWWWSAEIDIIWFRRRYGNDLMSQWRYWWEDKVRWDLQGKILETNDWVFYALRTWGYDGVVFKNIIDYWHTPKDGWENAKGWDVVTTFKSNQFKTWDNEDPTDSKYIRYQKVEYDYSDDGKLKWIKYGEDNSERDPSIFWTPTREEQIEEDKENEKNSPFYNAWMKYNNQNYKDDQLTFEEFIQWISERADNAQKEYDYKMRDLSEAQNDPYLLDLQLRAVKLMEEEWKVGKKFWKNVSKEVRDRQQAEVESKREKLIQDIVDYMYPWLKTEEITYEMQKEADQKEAEWEMLGREGIEEKLKYFKKDKNGNWEAKTIKIENPQEKLDKLLSAGKFDEIFTPVDRVLKRKTPQWQHGTLDSVKDPKKFKSVMEKINNGTTKTKVTLTDVTQEARALEKQKAMEEAEKERRKKEQQEAKAKKKQEEYKKLVRMSAFQRLIDMQRLEKYPFLSENEIKERYGFTDEEWKKITEQEEIKLPKKWGDKARSDFNKAVDSYVRDLIKWLDWQNKMKQREAEKNLWEIWEIDVDVLLWRDEEKGQKEVEEFERLAKEEKKKEEKVDEWKSEWEKEMDKKARKQKKQAEKLTKQRNEMFRKAEEKRNERYANKEEKSIDEVKTEEEAKNIAKDNRWKRTKRFWKDTTIQDLLQPISTRIEKISPVVYREMMRFEQNISVKTNIRMKQVEDFVKKMSEIRSKNKKDYINITLHLLNGNVGTANQMLGKYGTSIPRQVLDEIWADAEDVGYTMNYEWFYYPRKVKDVKEFLDRFAKIENKNVQSEIEKIIKKKREQAQKRWEEFTKQQEADLINQLLMDGEVEWITLWSGHMKQRKVDSITKNMLEFYEDPVDALLQYITWMTEAIEKARFLWQGKRWEIKTLWEFIADEWIQWWDAEELRKLLLARFNYVPMWEMMSRLKVIWNIIHLWNLSSALSQLWDISFSWIENSIVDIVEWLTKKYNLDLNALWVTNRWEELKAQWKNETWWEKTQRFVFKRVWFNWMDQFWKSTFVVSTLNKLIKYAKKNDPQLRKDLGRRFDDPKMIDQIIEDLKNWVMSENVNLFLFMKLADVQPLTRLQMPKTYLQAWNWRILYAFKTFSIKRLDYIIQKSKHELQTKPTAKALYTLVFTWLIMMLCDAWSDELKDAFYWRKYSSIFWRLIEWNWISMDQLSNRFWDEFLKLRWLTKYSIYQARTQGIKSAIEDIFFSLPWLDIITYPLQDLQDLMSEDGLDWSQAESFQLIPLLWKFHYRRWWKWQSKQQKSLDKEKKKWSSKNKKGKVKL